MNLAKMLAITLIVLGVLGLGYAAFTKRWRIAFNQLANC
jgi:hypothetical protein